MNEVLNEQASIGATINRFEQVLKLNQNNITNLNIKNSLITDSDIAEESLNFTLNSIKKDVQTSLLANTYQIRQDRIMNLINAGRVKKYA